MDYFYVKTIPMKYLLLLTLNLTTLAGYSQFRCAAEHSQSNNHYQLPITEGDRKQLKTTAVSIPVVFHVLYNDPSQNIHDSLLLANLRVLNRDFAKRNADTAQIPAVFRDVSKGLDWTFCLASVDPQGNPTTGIVRKYTDSAAFKEIYTPYDPATGGADLWPSNHYVNIIISNMDNHFYGYGTYPVNLQYQGINIDYQYVGEFVDGGGRLITHEMGHYFYLFHIWGDQACGDDLIFDTPVQQGPTMVLPSDPCPAFPRVSCNNGPSGDNFYNYMDYSRCASMFTEGQIARMENILLTMRASLLSSPAGCQFPASVEDAVLYAGIYPNPTTGMLNIRDDKGSFERVDIYDVSGRSVISSTFKRELMVELPSAGIYFYRLSGKGGVMSGKVVVE